MIASVLTKPSHRTLGQRRGAGRTDWPGGARLGSGDCVRIGMTEQRVRLVRAAGERQAAAPRSALSPALSGPVRHVAWWPPRRAGEDDP